MLGAVMAGSEQDRASLAPESVAVLAAARGMTIAPERLSDVTAVLSELLAIEAALEDLDLTGVDPNVDSARWPERER